MLSVEGAQQFNEIGIVNSFIPISSEKQFLPIFLTCSPIVTLSTLVHPEKIPIADIQSLLILISPITPLHLANA